MTRHRPLLAAAAAIVIAGSAVTFGTADAVDCAIGFASAAEENWVNAVHDHTTLTCLDARWIYRNRPGARDEFPGNHVWTSWVTKLPSPAVAGSLAAATEWCKVTTVEKYRAPIIPFGDHVLFSFRMEQTFTYNGTRVSAGPALIDTDITSAGWRWSYKGLIGDEDAYLAIPGFPNYQHQSDRWGSFSTNGIASIAAVSAALHDMIWVQANGDWRTTNVNGLSDCRNP